MGQNHTLRSRGSRRSISGVDQPLRSRQVLAAASIEVLEARRLLATIEGHVWNDEDNDQLRDYFENPVPNLTVFIDENQNSRFDAGEPTAVTDSKGFYRFSNLPVVPFDPDTGTGGTTYVIGHLPLLGEDQIPISQTAPGVTGKSNVTSAFDIEIVYASSGLGEEQKTLIESAVAVWEQVIIGDLPNVGNIDDLRIVVHAQAVDGPSGILAFATPTSYRPSNVGNDLVDVQGNSVGLPTIGEITIDIADISASRMFVETVAHEIGHIIGIGIVWYNHLVGVGTSSVGYIGANGVEEYNRLFGLNVSSVPVQASPQHHWDPNALTNELMEPFSRGGGENLPPDADPVQPLSRITIGAVEDFGYKVNYGRAEPYGPFNIGPLPEDLVPELGFSPFQITSFLREPAEAVDDANFGVRFNNKPDPFFFTAGPTIIAPGQPLRLLVELDTLANPKTTGDSDYRDRVIQFNFYRETNGVPGVQTSVDVARGLATSTDELLFEDADFSDGIEMTLDTTGLELGEQTFYARGYDRGFFVLDRLVNINFIPMQPVPSKPESLRAIALDRQTIQLNWIDSSTNENGFLLEVSTSPNFDVPDDITKIYLPPQGGTGAYNHELHVPQGELTTRHFRVRSYNTGGSSLFTGRVTARTLSRLEVLIDNEDDSRVRNLGNWQTIVNRSASINLTYLRGTSGFVEYDPQRTSGTDYFVFLNNPNISDPGRILVTVFSEDMPTDELTGEPIPFTMQIDQAASKGAELQIGRFRFGPGSFVRIEHISGIARIDTVRFLPVS